ncbi:MAG: hypothetical protein Q9203_002731 [Teloschistes exilis]
MRIKSLFISTQKPQINEIQVFKSICVATVLTLINHALAAPLTNELVARDAAAEPRLRLPAANEAITERDLEPDTEPETTVEVKDVDME